jgi:hypothetical protein
MTETWRELETTLPRTLPSMAAKTAVIQAIVFHDTCSVNYLQPSIILAQHKLHLVSSVLSPECLVVLAKGMGNECHTESKAKYVRGEVKCEVK